MERIHIHKDLIVAGAGVSGICCAVQAARLGLQVGLIEASGYLGGNAGPEVRVNVNGADGTSEFNLYSRTGGILDEIVVENLYRNPQGNAFHFEALLEDVIDREPNIQLFCGTAVEGVETEETEGGKRILSVQAGCWKEEKRYSFTAPLFADHTGDGVLGALAGAQYMRGRESNRTFGEPLAPEQADDYVLLGTLNYHASDIGKPVKYVPPDCAWKLEETDILKFREIPADSFYSSRWFYEIGGGTGPAENAELMKQHRALVYSIWDYVKNSGRYQAENYDLDYVSCTIGKREFRRFPGNWILTEQDLTERRMFEDCIGYGGWSVDLHAIHGFLDQDLPNRHYYLPGIYQIPFRCCVSREVENLFPGGRCASFSHVAHGSARVMGTLCTMGQAIGAAAWLSLRENKNPGGFSETDIKELQQLILESDGWAPGLSRRRGPEAEAVVTASSVMEEECMGGLCFRPLERDAALLLPVEKRMEHFRLQLRAREDTELKVQFFCSERREGYDPGILLDQRSIALHRGDDARWYEIRPAFEVEGRFVFVRLTANPAVEAGWSEGNCTLAVSLLQRENQEENIWDAVTGECKEFVWEPVQQCLAYQARQEKNIYRPDQAVNGYSRPYGTANCWRSAASGGPQCLRFCWEKEQVLSEVKIRFSADYNCRIYTHLDRNACRVLPEITREYAVFAETEEGRICLGEGKDNYRRENRICFSKTACREIAIELYQTNGAPYFSVDEVIFY